MTFQLPTSNITVDKYSHIEDHTHLHSATYNKCLNLWDIVNKYDKFKEIVIISGMANILNDPQANMTLFIPLDIHVSFNTLKSCVDNNVTRKDIIDLDFYTARTIVNSLIIPSKVTTTMLMQSAVIEYYTRYNNSLTFTTLECSSNIKLFNIKSKPPFNININNMSKIIRPDMVASNGIAHTISSLPFNISLQ